MRFPLEVLGDVADDPVFYCVRHHPDAAGYARPVPFVLGACSYVEDDRWVQAF